MDIDAVESRIAELERCISTVAEVSAREKLYVGVDLGTAYIVVVVVNGKGEPVACALEFAQVVRDGLVVDYVGATQIVRRLVGQLQERLGRELEDAAIAVPPGTGVRECATHRHVVEGAGLNVTSILDEPTAANAVLNVENGVIVDIGGGTTGLSILENGKVTYVADEPTGGTHLTLVLAGNYGVSFEEAEKIKKDPARQREVFTVVKPVIEKMASIINSHIRGRNVSDIYLVGGTCCLKDMEKIIAKETGKPVCKPSNPFLVTPLGIALNCVKKD
ncbi:MAG: ethanolamine utilization protein EutJ [Mailhella sp.]|nr:ethanolamine utilization protein EutJ [Mailhella sp.]MBQ4326372.1 ethanolamine utilization protein EutJ [Mailhella sp.]MBQ4615304.1 ethanolamine utilization protein EutJ [Mailhella sp.]